jgi:hypothetical protein
MTTSVSADRRAQIRPRYRPGAVELLWRRGLLATICVLMALLVASEGYLGEPRTLLIAKRAIGGQGFQLAAWEAQALQQKLRATLSRPGDDLAPIQQHDLVVDYFDTVDRINHLSREIERIHANPKEHNPLAAAAPLQAELDRLRAEQEQRRPAVERILQHQIGTILADTGLTTIGKVWPPVLFQFTESPDVLIISPRDRIVMQNGVHLTPGAPVSEMEQIEAQVEGQLDVSVLIEGTGGFSVYPTMVIAHPDLGWVLDTIVHEWMHTYLVFYPLGWSYFKSPDTRTLNETTATIVGNELGQVALARFYPDKVPPPGASDEPAQSGMASSRPRFDYGQTMRETRLHVEKLLAEGRIEEAEAYMEAQRRVLVANGYNLRKLNQAFFAFHGSYAVGPAATDPIGQKLVALREGSPNLLAFVETVRGITTEAELEAVLLARQ